MRSHTIKFKQENILCHRCVVNAVKALSQIRDVQGFNVDIDTKIIQVIYEGNKMSKEVIKETVNESIISGKIKIISH